MDCPLRSAVRCSLGKSSQAKLRAELPRTLPILHFTTPDEAVGPDVVKRPANRPVLLLACEDDAIALASTGKGIGHSANGIDPNNAPEPRLAIEPTHGRPVAVA